MIVFVRPCRYLEFNIFFNFYIWSFFCFLVKQMFKLWIIFEIDGKNLWICADISSMPSLNILDATGSGFHFLVPLNTLKSNF